MRLDPRIKAALAYAAPLLFHREGPQEHSHERYIQKVYDMVELDNKLQVVDPIFGLLVSADAAPGRGTVQDVECLQMAIADLAFTNAKNKHDLDGQVAALIYRALERNTEKVGVKSAICTSMRASNPEVDALEQLQDPASPNARTYNRAIILELARQIDSIGGDPLKALDAGTFEPGDTNDTSGRGNSCDDPDCIYENNRMQQIVSGDEVHVYVASCVPTVTVTTTVTSVPTPSPGNNVDGSSSNSSTNTGTSSSLPGSKTSSSDPSATGGVNLQTFGGNLGGIFAPPVYASGNIFTTGGHPFTTLGDALGRSCDDQHTQCGDLANSSKAFTVNDCDAQRNSCRQNAGLPT